MKFLPTPLALAFLSALSLANAQDQTSSAYSRTVFQDDFAGEGFGPRWGHYKSASIVKEGVLVGITPENSDHSAVDNVKIDPEGDIEVSVKFRFVSDKAKSFNLWLDDKDYKGSHAGHICNVNVAPAAVNVGDAKTGNFRNDIYEQKKTKEGLSPEQKSLLATKNARFPVNVSLQEWHTLLVQTKGDELSVLIDGQPVGSFKSEGVAHDTKTLVSLTTNTVDVHYDDFAIKAPAAKRP